MNKVFNNVTSNPLGAVAGGVVTFLAVKKFTGVKNLWAIGGIALVGALVGANVQGALKAKKSVPAKK